MYSSVVQGCLCFVRVSVFLFFLLAGVFGYESNELSSLYHDLLQCWGDSFLPWFDSFFSLSLRERGRRRSYRKEASVTHVCIFSPTMYFKPINFSFFFPVFSG
jgi:hypothetical protein